MARVTIEDCLEHIHSRFELVLVSSKRARQLANGAEALVEWENDKPTVVALREIAAGKINADILNDISAKAHAEESLVSEEELQTALQQNIK